VFATLLGALPTPDGDGSPVELAVRAQEEAGLEPITDGRLGESTFAMFRDALAGGAATLPSSVAAWQLIAGLTDRAVKQSLPGPYTLARRLGVGMAGDEGSNVRARRTHAIAEALASEVQALVAAGCPLVEIEEADAHLIGADEVERRLFRQAHRRLTDGVDLADGVDLGNGAPRTHLSLSIVGGSAAGAGIETILDAPYASLAVDLIAGPENWNLVTRAPGDRGIVAGAMGARPEGDEPKEILLWAAHYAASTSGRGLARVGLGSAGSYANLSWEQAVRKMRLLGTAAKLAELPPGDELTGQVDPQAVSARRAALGRNAPKPPKRPRR
jgi:methionine synthase II (cobalamin-independent)